MRKLNYIDWLLVLMISLSALTELRIWKIGPSELLMLLWFILLIIKFKSKLYSNMIINFWFFFLFFLIIGFINSEIRNLNNNFSFEETLTYITFFLFSIGLSIYFSNVSKRTIAKVILFSYWICFSLYTLLFILSFFVGDVLGYSLYFGGLRFSPLSSNPHQFVYLSGTIILLALFSIHYLKTAKIIKVTFYLSVLIYFYIILGAESSAFYAASLISLVVGILYFLRKTLRLPPYLFISIIFFTSALVVLNMSFFIEIIIAFMHSDEGGMVRVHLWIEGIEIFIRDSLFMGLGPGAHIPTIILSGGYFEAHQTFIDIALRAGIGGLLAYIILLIKLLKFSRKHTILLVTLIFTIVYSLSGFTLRRISFWFACFVITKFAQEEYNENFNNR